MNPAPSFAALSEPVPAIVVPVPEPGWPQRVLPECIVAMDCQLRASQVFRPEPEAVGRARRTVRQLLPAWGLPDLLDVAELVLSELLTNAVKATQVLDEAQPVGLWLLSGHATVVVIVWDGDPRPPIRSEAAIDDEAGRGLMLVEALSADWGYCPAAGYGGKFVWALIDSA